MILSRNELDIESRWIPQTSWIKLAYQFYPLFKIDNACASWFVAFTSLQQQPVLNSRLREWLWDSDGRSIVSLLECFCPSFASFTSPLFIADVKIIRIWMPSLHHILPHNTPNSTQRKIQCGFSTKSFFGQMMAEFTGCNLLKYHQRNFWNIHLFCERNERRL